MTYCLHFNLVCNNLDFCNLIIWIVNIICNLFYILTFHNYHFYLNYDLVIQTLSKSLSVLIYVIILNPLICKPFSNIFYI